LDIQLFYCYKIFHQPKERLPINTFPRIDIKGGFKMTAIRQEAMKLLDNIPDEKLGFVIHIMKGINEPMNNIENKKIDEINLEQFVMPATERGQSADEYVRGLRDNDRI
jgi:hypothetical protein